VNVAWIIAASLLASTGQSEVDFDTHIVPLLTKAGCNAGACHGAGLGRGGFKLSLYGGNPRSDFEAIALELEGRRINLARPDESLILLKATESIEHGGGTRFDIDSPAAKRLQEWIEQGAGRLQRRTLVEYKVSPRSLVVESVGMPVQLKAMAQFSDGSTADVTAWTVFTAEDATAVRIDPETANASVLRRGRHIVVARYLDRVVPIELIVPLSDAPVDLTAAPRNNFIDDHVNQSLARLRVQPAPQADDATILRRATLDLTGRLPTIDQHQEYALHSSDRKYEQLIDRLLASEAFTEYWTFRLANLLRIRSAPNDNRGALAYHRWLKSQIADAAPYDQLARDLLLASGDTWEVGPANFFRTAGGPREMAEFASELFMGNRLRCANCHNHPLDRWTQDDYHGLAAIFAKVDRGRMINVAQSGEVIHPRTGEPAAPRIPGERFVSESGDPREPLADWLTSPDNPYFAKAIVNRLWLALMGRGLVEPADDLRATNPATHPALLAQLAEDFVAHGYDMRHTLRQIALSAAYRRGGEGLPREVDPFYSRSTARPLPAEVLADAITDVLGIAERYGDHPVGTRAVSLFDSNIESETLDVLGRCSREDSCEGTSETGGLARMLHLLNGPLLNRRIADSDGRLAKLIAAGETSSEIVEEFYALALCRPPREEERAYWNAQIEGAESKREVLEDFVWSLLTSREFVSCH